MRLVKVGEGFCVVDDGVVESNLYCVNNDHLVYEPQLAKRHMKKGVEHWEDFSIVGVKYRTLRSMISTGTIKIKE